MPRKANKDKAQNQEPIEIDEDIEQVERIHLDDGNIDEDLLNIEIPPMPESLSLKEGGERLVISHIEVENFKSYYGKQIIGPFHKCFTSIIGPNGSGKSNVIDALLFVFGYRASKIRSKKVSVLIHSSAGRDNVQFCTVSVHFCRIIDHENGSYTKFAGSDIKVSRTAYKDNSSKYTMNGKTVKFKEIAELLRSNGIDLVHNRFLILQGEVEQISMMKPKAEKEEEEGMLEYLEDIIGSNRLKPYIIKLQKKIEQINDQRAIQIQRVQHAEKEKLQLDGPARDALGQMRLENAITSLNNKIFLSKRYEYADKVSKIKAEKDKLEEELNTAQEKLAQIVNQAKQISRERQQLQSKIDKSHESVQLIEKQKAAQEQVIAKSDNDAKRLQNKRDKFLKEVQIEENKLAELESAPEESQKKIDEYRKQLDEANNEIEEFAPILMRKLEEVKEKTNAEIAEKLEVETELGKYSAEEDQLNSNLAIAQEKLLNLRREEQEQRSKFDALQAQLLDTEELLTKHEKDLKTTDGRFTELQTTYEGKQARLKHLKERETRLVDRIREIRRECEEYKQTEESYKSANKIVNRIMEVKRTGEISGILGRLGDLGAIDGKYDVAISTNFTGLDIIVVDDVDTAQKCIELLKREQLGVCSFLALKKQEQFWPNIKSVPKTPENAPRLIDLIRVNDQQVLPAFYYVLGDTLVADDITSATRIAMGSGRRWKTVTLKGELVDVSGAMTGGGNPQTRSRIGREVRVNTGQDTGNDEERRQEIAALEQEKNNIEAELTTIQRESNQLEPELRSREEDLKRISDSIRNLKFEIENNTNKANELRRQIEMQKKNVINSTANPEEVRKAQEEVDKFTSENAKIAKKTDSLRVRLMGINERIEEIKNKIAGPFEKRKRDAEEKKKNAEAGANKERANIASNERNKKKAKDKITNIRNDIESSERQLEAVMERISDAKNRLAESEELLNQRKAELEEAKQALEDFVQSIGERNDEEVELQKQVEEQQRDLKKMTADLATHESKLKSYASKQAKLRLYRLKKLTESLSKEFIVPANSRSNEEDEDENDENLDLMVARPARANQRKAFQQVNDDGLDPYLEDCLEEREFNGRANVFMEIGEQEDHRMEIDEDADEEHEEANTSHHNASHALDNSSNQHNPYVLQHCFMPLPLLDEAKIRELNVDELAQTLEMLESRRKKQRINLGLVMDYMQKLNRYELQLRNLHTITELRDKHRALHDRLKKQRLHEFMEGFQQIATQLRTTYQMITIQGDVSLELVDSLDPFAEGIAFNVRPPKKSWKQITNLSGGEKTLASLSLVFGLHHYKPTPLYVMDEIDAALDFRNVSIIANYLLERTRNAQFIVISLRNQMYEKADRLIGIYKIKDCTRNVCVDPQKSILKIEQ